MQNKTKQLVETYAVPLVMWGLILFAFFSIKNVLFPLTAGFGLAYMMSPLLHFLRARSIPFWLSVIILYIGTLGLLILVAIYVLPPATVQLIHLLRTSPEHLMNLYYLIMESLSQSELGQIWETNVLPIVRSTGSTHISGIVQSFLSTTETFLSRLGSTALSLANVALFPIFFYYGLARIHTIPKQIEHIIPRQHHHSFRYFIAVFDQISSCYIRGQFIVSLCLGIMYAIGLWLIGLPYGLLIGFLSGLFNIIPYFGFIAGLSIGIITVLVSGGSFLLLVSVIGIFIAAQVVESVVLTPRIIGQSVGLDPFITLLVIIMGGNILGVMGMLVAVPIAGVINHIFSDYLEGKLTLKPMDLSR